MKRLSAILAFSLSILILVPIALALTNETAPTSTGKVATPIFDPLQGTFETVKHVSLKCNTDGATIYFTTNGAIPTTSSQVYDNPFIVLSNTTLRAKAFKSGMSESEIATAVYTITATAPNIEVKTDRVATPAFSLTNGNYLGTQVVYMICATSEATIHYTTNGEIPTSSSRAYTEPIIVTSSLTIRAKAFKPGLADSETATASYTIGTVTTERVAKPIFSLSSGNYSGVQSIVISCSTTEATVYYTTNGATPTNASTIYDGPITINGTMTIKAKAFKSGAESSETATATYAIAVDRVTTPTFSVPSGTYVIVQSVTISCGTSGTMLYYTTDGTIPTKSSLLYDAPISVTKDTTIKAKAFEEGMKDSETATASYEILLNK